MALPELKTQRLVLRAWRDEDVAPFAALNADPEVMAFMPSVLSRDESDALVDRIRAHFAQYGFGPWAIEVPGVAPFVGFTGLMVPSFEAHFTPCVEVGWRLARGHWGLGYAQEAARAAIDAGFERLGLSEVYSFTVPANERSRRVMARVGLEQVGQFDHPKLEAGHPLRPHVLYRITQAQWRAQRQR